MASDIPHLPSRRGASAAIRPLPGLLLCGAVAAAATGVRILEEALLGRAWLEGLVLAILLGAAIRTAWAPGPVWKPGVDTGAKLFLELAIVLLGASAGLETFLSVGPAVLVGIGLVVGITITASYGVGRLLGLRARMAILVACGTAICGNSAIAAVAPVVGAKGDDVAASIAFTAVLGVVAVLVLPLVGAALHLNGLQYGTLAGLTVYAVPQVLPAAAPMGAQALQVGTLVKLVRVLMLGPVCLGLGLLARRRSARIGERRVPGRPAEAVRVGARLVPWFIVGFFAMSAARTMGLIPPAAQAPMAATAQVLTAVAMAALGLATDLRTVAAAGARVTAAVALSLLGLGLLGYGLIRGLGL